MWTKIRIAGYFLLAGLQLAAQSPKWELVWSDKFNYKGLPDSAKWNYDTRGNTYGWGNNEKQWYTEANPRNAYVDKGTLKITARSEETSGKAYSSARLTTSTPGSACASSSRRRLATSASWRPGAWRISGAWKMRPAAP